MKGYAIPYSDAELRFIEANHAQPRRALHAAFVREFGRDDVTVGHLHALCKRRGWSTGSDGRFAKGNAPHNKGKAHPAARSGNCALHHFRKGERRGAAVTLYKPIGSERLSKEGYLERKVNDDRPERRRWRAVHLLRWEAANGALPKGTVLKCVDGDKRNTDPSNWTPVPRALLPRLNGRYGRDYDAAPAELKPAILAIAKLEHAAREAPQRNVDVLRRALDHYHNGTRPWDDAIPADRVAEGER